MRVSEAMGAGALALIEQVAAPLEAAREAFGGAGASGPATSLAILWSPTRTPACLACYLPTGWGPVVLEGQGEPLTFAGGIFLSGTQGTPHHFTPSTVAHELGHWVMDAYSRFPDTGGAHGWEEPRTAGRSKSLRRWRGAKGSRPSSDSGRSRGRA